MTVGKKKTFAVDLPKHKLGLYKLNFG